MLSAATPHEISRVLNRSDAAKCRGPAEVGSVFNRVATCGPRARVGRPLRATSIAIFCNSVAPARRCAPRKITIVQRFTCSGFQVLQGKRIAVTGAFGALGLVVARAVVAAGASAAGIARAPVSNAPPQLDGVALFGDADIGDARVAEATLRAVAQKL